MEPGVIATAVIFFAVIWMVKILSDNRIRRLLIEKDMVSEKAKFLYQREYANVPGALKWGFVCVGIGLAFLVGQLVHEHVRAEITAAAIFMLAGLGLILYYFSARAIDQKSRENDE